MPAARPQAHQIHLSVGVSTVKVKVTPEDAVTTKTYTLSLTLSLALFDDRGCGFDRKPAT